MLGTVSLALACAAAVPWLADADPLTYVAPRALMQPTDVGALRVQGTPYPNDILNGLYYPTAVNVNGKMAYKKENLQHKSELWLAMDPNGFWAIQPTDSRGSDDVFMVSAIANAAAPQDAGTWQLWESGAWQLENAVSVVKCEGADAECNAMYKQELDKAAGGASLPSTCSYAGKICAMSSETIMDSWAWLSVGGVLSFIAALCLCMGNRLMARSYVWNTVSNATMLVVGFLVAQNLLNFVTFDFWSYSEYDVSFPVSFILFTVGFFGVHFLCWKCQYSPERRTLTYRGVAILAACFGACAVDRLKMVLVANGWKDNVWLQLWLVIGTALVLALYAVIANTLHQKTFAEPSAKSWPQAPTMVKVGDKSRSCVSGVTKMFKSSDDHEEGTDPSDLRQDGYYPWQEDANFGQCGCISVIMALLIDNLANFFFNKHVSSGWVTISFVIFCIVLGIILALVRNRVGKTKYREETLLSREGMLFFILSTTCCFLLGLSLYGIMWQFAGMTDQDWWSCSCGVGPHIFGVLGLTLVGLVMVKVLSRKHTDEDLNGPSFGLLNLKLGPFFPQEVDIIAMMLGWAWSRFILGAVQDVTRRPPVQDKTDLWYYPSLVIYWDAAWNIVLGTLLFLFWRVIALPKAEKTLKHHDADIKAEKEAPSMQPVAGTSNQRTG